MTDSRHLMAQATRLRFEGPLEARFRDDYFEGSITLARAALAALMLMWAAFGVLDIYALPVSYQAVWVLRFGLILPLWIIVLVWSFLPGFRAAMQAAIAFIVFAGGSAITAMTSIARPGELGSLLYGSGLILAPLCGYSFLRLRFWSATIANFAVMGGYILTALFYQHILARPQGATILINNLFFVIGANIAGMATCYSLEFSARRAFASQVLLEEERLGEQRKREQTEAMLQILSQAIGGIVHDLGNPLTSVQTGVEVLEMTLDSDESDPAIVRELIGFIDDGAQMLNALRLSLMEQTRVLEGQPTPVELAPVPIARIAQTAARHQNPRYRTGRSVSFHGPNRELCADELKMVTVLMNLVANALKYSDGDVQIGWRAAGDCLLIAVSDQGRAGRGITRAQAQQLFVPFGRLETHSHVEGTGLGLLSARHIVAAHGGEIFIEGRAEGTPDSPQFSTAQTLYPPQLAPEFATAFVLSCPLAPT